MSDSQGKHLPENATTDGANFKIDTGDKVTDLKGVETLGVGEEEKPTRVFVKNLPRGIRNESLAAEFLQYGISVRNASIRAAWNNKWTLADVVVDAEHYERALAMNGRRMLGRNIMVAPFKFFKGFPTRQRSHLNLREHPANMQASGSEMRFSVDITAVEWSVLQLFRIIQGQSAC
ncbi:hypothetical protein B0H14DRAFT_3173273 [Mycena olivaceomarginata]|nr:hypothetical protein B0H14DRAFT_3173273 [Mycena olivaceomarginata]